MALWRTAFLFVVSTLLSTLVGCGGGGGKGGPEGPPAGSVYVRIRMLRVTSVNGPVVELATSQLTVPLASTSDAFQVSDPGFQAAFDADVTAISNAVIPSLQQQTESLLAADALLPVGQQKLASSGASEYLMISGGPQQALFWPEKIKIQNHALTDTAYFDSQIRQRIRERLDWYITGSGGKMKHVKRVWLEFAFSL